MNREIRFRAWVPSEGLMIQHREVIERAHLQFEDNLNASDIVMQYIGVKGYTGEYEQRHKNEVDLYEGDIVEAMSEGSKGRFVITFRQEAAPMYILYPAWQHGKMWNIKANNLGRKDGSYFDDLRVIGNIYQNKNLIEP